MGNGRAEFRGEVNSFSVFSANLRVISVQLDRKASIFVA